MSQTAQAVVQNLVDRAVKLGDRQLAADIRAFAAQRQFGLAVRVVSHRGRLGGAEF